MNLYSRCLFPRLMDLSMSGETLAAHRRSLLANTFGRVLEIGFGTGLNLPFYPQTVTQLTTVDNNPGARAIAARRLQKTPPTFEVESRTLSSESLPMADQTFDCVVSTWTLCSISNVTQALQEIHRVLKPGGHFFFVEHGLSDNPKVQVWQNRLNPIQRVIGDGCNFNRNMRQLVEAQFSQVEIEAFPEPDLPAVMGYFYKGSAIKSMRAP
jgi:ubiquinone/menaquinone biosynthesis C-methylase UbiE